MAIKVTCQMKDYSTPAKPSIIINNHWNDSRLVEIQIGDERFTVKAADLKNAVDNCTNTG